MLKKRLAQEAVGGTTATVTQEPPGLRWRRLPHQSEKRRDDSAEDREGGSAGAGTLMSHSPSPGAVAFLAPSVIAGTKRTPLIALGGAADRLTPRKLDAAREAVDVPTIAAATDDDLLATAGAGVETMGGGNRGLFGHERDWTKEAIRPQDAP